jgi:hypothetical protein
MADIRCPNCGRDNPDFLDTCQFCQTPLRVESTLHTGESPVKKNTGELEPILPQWLKDMRQQARESAEADAAASAAQPRVRNEPPDLLAGLASQTREDEEAVPDWLTSINPITKPKTVEPPASEPSGDFFSQFSKSAPEPATPPAEEPAQEEIPSWMSAGTESPQVEKEKDELSEWFAKAAAQPDELVEVEHEPSADGILPSFKIKEPEPAKEQEDLSWLHSLEATSFQPSEPAAPQIDSIPGGGVEPGQPAAEGDDLSWLNELGGLPTITPEQTIPSVQTEGSESFEQDKTPPAQNDMSWLDQLGGLESPVSQEPEPVAPASQENLDWLNVPDVQAPKFEEKPAEDLSWLQALEEKESTDSTEKPVSAFSPSRTGPLGEGTAEESMPDWLKSATEEPSMPAPGALSEWFRESTAGAENEAPLSQPQPVPSENVDSILSGDLPDWFSTPEPGTEEKSASAAPGADALSPVDLPAWVQAMRPVESVIEEAPSVESQPTEREGPLAGLRGVIPAAPIGSAIRPKAISIKLQASDEQQAAAVILEQILAGETNPKPLVTSPFVASQRVLRWILSGLFIIVLSTMLFLGTQSMPVSAALPVHVSSAANAVAAIPQNSSVLVVIDYEPALAGELEAVSGPMLDQLVSLSRPRLSFIATSPNSSALVERLLSNTRISLPAPNGLDYKPGADYYNLGYLPGGASGVVEFVESPISALPSAGIGLFSEYAAVILLTDHSESARVWVEQLDARRQVDPSLANQPLLVAASAQAGPLLQPYVSSRQVTGMVNGIADAARYEFVNNGRPGLVRRYWDVFGVGLLMAIIIISAGSLLGLVMGIRERRAEAELG